MMLPLTELLLLRTTNKIKTLTISVKNIRRFNNGTEELNDTHVFKKIWKKRELIDHLCRNVYYEDDNYIVLNKPYGVFSRYNRTKQVTFVEENAACESALSDILPDLSSRFEAKDLNILVNPERYFSGVTLLSKGTENKENLLKNFQSIPKTNRTYSFLTVVLGNPSTSLDENFQVYFNKETNKYELILNTKKSGKGSKKIKSTKVHYKHEKLTSSEHASLMKVDLNYNFLHCLKLVLATKWCSPVLGDFEHTSRLTTLFNVPLLVPSGNHLSNRKNVPLEILKRLQLNPEDVDCCPCHIHLYSMTFSVKGKKFVASVPPPEYFVFTCDRLGLKLKQFLRGFDDYGERKQAEGH